MKRGFSLLWLLLVCLPIAAHAAPGARAWLDRDTMQLGETVTLNVEVADGSSTEPDFSVLLQDFKSLGTQSSRQFSMTNGQATAKTVWAIGLEPKHAGTLAIPAFMIGAAATTPLSLTVLPTQTGAQGKPGDSVFVEVSAEPLSPYVQQQVHYTVKLYYAVDLTEGALDEPSAAGVVVQKLGRDKQYNTAVGERRYHVLERHYALIPEQSGPLTMPVLGFRGSALDTSDPTGFFRRGRAISARSDAIELSVRAKPASWGAAAWLPAASLSVTDESELPGEVTVGEPVTRTIRLRAQGLGFEQLPELDLKAPPGTEIYPDKPDTQTRDDGNWLYGERTRKFAIVPTRPGTLSLPAIEVQWWDTNHDRLETTVLAAREITVLPAAGAPNPPAAGVASPQAAAPASGTVSTSVIYPSGEVDGNARLWRSLAIAAAALWLITLALWWRSRRGISDAVRSLALPPAGTSPGRSLFLRACALGDLAAAERALVGWARSERPELRNLGEVIANLGDDEQRTILAELERVRYAGAVADGLGARLGRAFRDGLKWVAGTSDAGVASPLPALYPHDR
jgi:hypothetical protein